MNWSSLLAPIRSGPRSCLSFPFILLVAAIVAIPLFVYQQMTGRSLFSVGQGSVLGGSETVEAEMWNPPTGDATGGRTEAEWRTLLQQLSDLAIADYETRSMLTSEQIANRWLGEPPASDEGIAAAERRLGIALPPSYKAFLRASNGWNHPIPFIRRLAPVEKIGWLRDVDPEFIRCWREGTDYARQQFGAPAKSAPDDDLEKTLVIKLPHEEDDAAFYMLNPVRVTNGELEAWFFSNWNPGARAYRSFWDLMVAQRESFREIGKS